VRVVRGALAPLTARAGGVGAPAEGRQASAEGAGLVPFKTSPIEPQNGLSGEVLSLTFNPQEGARKRVRRLKANVWLAGHLHGIERRGHRPSAPWFVTLTYAAVDGWKPNHIAESMDAYRRWCKRRGVPCRYLFVAELQARGAVHYHLLVWLPSGVRMPMWDKSTRSSRREVRPFWTHGMTNTQPAKAGVGYLMKYLSKLGELTVFPQGIRLYGMGGLSPEARAIRTWQNLPQWVKHDHGVGDICRVAGRLVDASTGELLPPMWRRKFVPGGLELHRLRDMPPKLYDHGAYCTWPRP